MATKTNRITIGKECSFQGIGLHLGKDNTIVCKPAKANEGITFYKGDQSVRLATDKVKSTQRGTTIENNNLQVHTVEHLLAALHALHISDLNIEIEGEEIPILDGSAKPFFDKFKDILVELKQEADCIVIHEKLSYTDIETGSKYEIIPHDGLSIESTLSYDDPVIGNQSAVLTSLSEFGPHISSSRTFVLASELELLFSANLIKGGRPDNALVFKDSKISNAGIEKLQKLLKTNAKLDLEGEVINDLKPHFENEPARHKLLDLIGDLYLTGLPLKAKIKAYKPGHTSNLKLAKFLYEYHQTSKQINNNAMYNPNAKAILNVTEIQSMLPHRYPFLMVDKVIEQSDNHIVGVKNVTINENFFQGHFPGNPVFPGVLQMEALAQCGGILALSQSEEGNWDTYFVKMDKVKFRNMVYPGDSLILHMELMMPIRRGIVKMYGKAIVGDKIMSEGELTAKIVKREE